MCGRRGRQDKPQSLFIARRMETMKSCSARTKCVTAWIPPQGTSTAPGCPRMLCTCSLAVSYTVVLAVV
ncbi:hypothetical protein E2C01_075041 [Portunus trituberculatus]|uniref:Uncharacterized protein n=1 Tax=Portunus trituberculatus TaxID=210409 RepID=A0A5B7I508_PORTR|nr:hypothetical protein [Portunus trituberculatus]